MLIHQTLERLHELRLTGMAQALEEQMHMPDLDWLAFEDRLALLVERETTFRDDRRLTRLLKAAKLRLSAAPEDIDFRTPRGLDKGLILRLAGSQWIRDHDNVLTSGPTGTGKSYLACALGQAACRLALSTRFYRFSRLLGELAPARAAGPYAKLLDRLAKAQLLILDDFGLAPLTDTQHHDVLDLLEDRYRRRATLVPASSPSTTGTPSSVTPPSPMPSWTVSSTTPTASPS